MKQRRGRRYACALFSLAVIATSIWFLTIPGPRINKATYDQLEIGMTLAEVEKLINAPPGDFPEAYLALNVKTMSIWGKGKRIEFVVLPGAGVAKAKLQPQSSQGRVNSWWRRNRLLVVNVDDHDFVAAVRYVSCTKQPTGWFDRCLISLDEWLEGKD